MRIDDAGDRIELINGVGSLRYIEAVHGNPDSDTIGILQEYKISIVG